MKNQLVLVSLLFFLFSFCTVQGQKSKCYSKRSVYYKMFKKYEELGACDGFLGRPIKKQQLSSGGDDSWYKGGWVTHFERGSIYWSAPTGAHEVHGAIRQKWTALGAEKSHFGYPTSDEIKGENGVRYSKFERGVIYWSRKKGVWFKRIARPKKAASLTLFHLADGPLSTLSKKANMNLKETRLADYEHSILLKNTSKYESYLDGYSLKPKAPTKANFFKALEMLVKRDCYIDIFIIADGNSTGIKTAKGIISPQDIKNKLNALFGKRKFPIRMVYQVNSYGAAMNDAFYSVGAKVVAGARSTNFMPFRFNTFLEKWHKGLSFGKTMKAHYAEKGSNECVKIKSFIAAQYKSFSKSNRKKKGWNCDFLKETLDESKTCIIKFFEKKYAFKKSGWQNGKSGWHNIYYSSYKRIKGDKSITIKTKPKW